MCRRVRDCACALSVAAIVHGCLLFSCICASASESQNTARASYRACIRMQEERERERERVNVRERKSKREREKRLFAIRVRACRAARRHIRATNLNRITATTPVHSVGSLRSWSSVTDVCNGRLQWTSVTDVCNRHQSQQRRRLHVQTSAASAPPVHESLTAPRRRPCARARRPR